MNAKTLRQVIDEKSNDYGLSPALSDPNACPPAINSKKPPTVSVVIPAYNSRGSILACLASLEQSSYNLKHQDSLQVIVVDDGSKDDTWSILKQTDFSLHLTYIRQNNSGQAQALNTGISVSEGDIIISCDSDMVLGYYAIEYFVAAQQQMPNTLFAGFRQDIPAADRKANIVFIRKHGSHRQPFFSNDERIIFPVPGWPDNMCLASDHFKKLGRGRRLWMPDNDVWLLPDMVIGALFSLSRQVFFEVGGYDERLIGWGCTDGYLAAKAIGAGQFIAPLYAATGLHIHHPVRLKNRQQQYESNRKLFFKFIDSTKIDRHPDWLSHAKNRIVESFVSGPGKKLSRTKTGPGVTDQSALVLNQIDNLLAVGRYSLALNTIKNLPASTIDPELSLRMGKALLGLNRFPKAIRVLSEIPASPEVTVNLAIALAAAGRFRSAGKTLKRLAEIYPETTALKYWYKTPAEKHIWQGRQLFKEEFYAAASRCFDAALIIDPKNITVLKYRKQCRNKLKL